MADAAIIQERPGFFGRLSDMFWRRPLVPLILLLTPPLIWLGVI